MFHKCRSLLTTRNSSIVSSGQIGWFHSTPICNEKWKKKWTSDFRRGQQPSKNYVKYATRQKRADAKKALQNLLFHNGAHGTPSQDEERWWKLDEDEDLEDHRSTKKGQPKSYSRRAQKIHNHKMRRKLRKEILSEDEEHPETIFHATFGNRWYTWSFNWDHSSFQSSTSGFDWRDNFGRKKNRHKEWDSESETDSDDETCEEGSLSDRAILGLPLNGPLKMEEVKNAFRLSALKWHPDKHQGSSQGAAEERFKQCVNAYKSLCTSLSVA